MSGRTDRRFRPLRDLPVVGWLLLLVISSAVHPWLPAPRWLMIHLLLLGAVTHAILVWSRHFTDTLLRLPERAGDQRSQGRRLLLLNLGVTAVIGGVLTDTWPLTVAGASGVSLAVGWHGVDLVLRLRRALPNRFRVTVYYYVAAATMLPLGAALGTGLAHGFGDPTHEQLKLAHAVLNLLGWMGLTVAGTLITLWPTMLRTRIAEGAERTARRALPLLLGTVLLTAAAAIAGRQLLTAIALVGYLAALSLALAPLVRIAIRRPPHSFPTLSVAAAVLWWYGGVLVLAGGLATAADWHRAAEVFTLLVPYLAAGFGAQVLLGALSHLLPVSLSRGPASIRALNRSMHAGTWFRVALVNLGLLVCLLPVPSMVRVLASLLVLGGLAAFLPLMVLTIRRSRHRPPAADAEPGPTGAEGQVATALAAVVLAIVVGVAVDPLGLAVPGVPSAAAGVAATGATTTVQVEARGMRFIPDRIEVPAGNRLVIELRNTDDGDVHDLRLDSGADSGRLSPGQSATIDVGVVGRDLAGWCTVVGHRQMGMVLEVVVSGAAADHDHAAPDTSPAPTPTPDHVHDPEASPGSGFTPHDAVLPPLSPGRLHRHTFTVSEINREVAPGITQELWTFGGSAPGPVLHGRVGDRFEITLVNDGSIGHSIDFHAGALAPDEPMRTIAPGERLSYRFTATRAGIWMYHCSSMPMSAHIANGMFGAVVIEPPDLPEVDLSYLLIQSELYLGAEGGTVDVDKVNAEEPDLVVFNGYADQYDHRPLAARVGERVRVWVLNAGPNRGTSFHVVGGQFNATYAEGTWLLEHGEPGGAQALSLAPAQGGFVELTFPEAGHYPFVSHVMVDAERGAHGIFRVQR